MSAGFRSPADRCPRTSRFSRAARYARYSAASPTIHADPHTMILEDLGKCIRGEHASLVGIEDGGDAESGVTVGIKIPEILNRR